MNAMLLSIGEADGTKTGWLLTKATVAGLDINKEDVIYFLGQYYRW